MKVYDCFLYCDEDIILDVRLNTLNKYVDFFVIVESVFYHNGKKKGLNFNFKKFKKFKSKIIYIPIYKKPKDLIVSKNKTKIYKKIMNALRYENGQRDAISLGLLNCKDNDAILISDIDEIPNLSKINFKKIENKIIFFCQKYFYYKFNLLDPNTNWLGSRLILFKNLKSPQWLRNMKAKKYPFWRIDKLLNEKNYQNFQIIKNGGWHFSYLKNPKGILNKINTYLHYTDFNEKKLSTSQISKYIKTKKPIYNLNTDQRNEKLDSKIILKKSKDKDLPEFIIKNKKKYQKWFV